MARRRGGAKRYGERGPKFVQMHYYVMRTAAWLALSAVARALYLELKSHYNGQNNGTIGMSVRQGAHALGMSTATASRAFAELVDHGFLIETTKGIPGGGSGFNKATEWLLLECRDDRSGTPPSKLFMKWAGVPLVQREIKKTVTKTAQRVAQVKRDGIQIPQEGASRYTGATSEPVFDDPTLHGCNTLTSSHTPDAEERAATRAPTAEASGARSHEPVPDLPPANRQKPSALARQLIADGLKKGAAA